MICPGCYKPQNNGYCVHCRKKLFDGLKVSATLPFNAPQNANILQYNEHTRRLSISGMQLKYSLKLEGIHLELSDAGGHYILKPVPYSLIINREMAPENEHLTMQIASQVFKIEAAANALIYFADGQPAYITRRFDVRSDGTKFLVEDFAQLSGKQKATHGEHYKYDGSYEDVGVLIKKYVAAYMPVMEKYFSLIFFNYLFSNGDAHLKNFSLYRTANGDYQLTPAYDLLSTIIHSPGETDTALDLFEGDINTAYYQEFGHHGYPDFMDLARKLSLVDSRAKRILATMISKSDEVTLMVNKSFLSPDIKVKYLENYADKVSRIKVT